MRVSVKQIRARLRGPFSASHGTVTERPLVLLSLGEPDSGLCGHGEAAPLAGYDGVGVDDVLAGLQACRELLEDADLATVADLTARGSLIGECSRRAALPQALAAIDLALHDLAARAHGVSVTQLLGGAAAAPAITVNATIDALDPDLAAAAAADAVASGFATVKVKVGLDRAADLARVAAVRATGGDRLAIRLDANGAWGRAAADGRALEAARHALEALAPCGIELCEEPLQGVEQIELLAAQVPVALALDESAAQAPALQRRCAQAICLKISRCGGIAGVLRDASRARALGYEVYLASTLDGPLGIAAALHCAALIGPDRPCGLATLGLFADRRDPLRACDGRVALPAGVGLGEGLLDFYGPCERQPAVG